jgi:Asp/Glu/hydantoin racemase
MLRIRSITPIHVDVAELERRQRRYDRLAPTNITVQLDDLGDGRHVPRALDTEDDIRRSEQLVIAEIHRTDPNHFDAVLPDCVLDPGVGVITGAPVPVLGLLQLSSHLLASSGQRFAAVTRNSAIADELVRKLTSYGIADTFAGVRILGLSVTDIADDDVWAAAINRSVADLTVNSIINGCSAVEVQVPMAGPSIVDPTATALRVIALAAELGFVRPERTAV